ncbi:DUF6090 family protein [Mariniflexile sp.]|uniref:DUF6090 family protein n=1 Tax=Mariniflexile sp. TaxID=1979402 RepID=UPI0040474345
MIKFFRKIRQNSIKENKATNYLKYAIGEIILVVIGILIALSINNWNNNKINKNESIEFSQRLLTEVNGNIDLSTNAIEQIQDRMKGSKKILELFNEPVNNENSKSLDSLIYKILTGVTVEFRTGTLNEGLNTGKVALINSNILKSKLYGLSSNIENVREFDKINAKYSADVLQTFLYKNFNFRKMDNNYSKLNIGPSKFKSEKNELLLNNEEFENLIDNYFYLANSQLRIHNNLRKEFIEVKKLLDE